MWMLKLIIKPTSGLTFRRMPSSVLHISTYPFLPPTTMSGFLRRLKLLEAGHFPETAVKDPDYYALPPQLCPLGAYPKAQEYCVHTTKRQGIRAFNHNAFSRIVRYQSQREVYQLHTWEYLFAESLIGYVVSEDKELLNQLKTVTNFGCKIGKEGYAFVDRICGPIQLTLERTCAEPDTLLPGAALAGIPCEAFPLYRYAWEGETSADTPLEHPEPSSIKGFIPFVAGETQGEIELDYYTDGAVHLPKLFIDELRKGAGGD
ncbi:hypothetical protein C6502_07560 [Candidatus Poribacteria bacterium]|nr:MAG: hypothetical protein C6502_07560 [Candidatus Poribacteria bacterium]